MSSFFDDLEAQLRSAARARASAPAAGREAPRKRGRWRGWVRAGIGAVPVVAAVLMTLVVVGGALVLLARHRTSPPTPPSGNGISAILGRPPSKQTQQELGYIAAATRSIQNSKACRVEQPTRLTYVNGAPGSDLLSILGVLRRPSTPADRLKPGSLSGTADVYRAYVRRAFSSGGFSYYIVPSRFDRAATVPSDRCLELQAAALNRGLPKVPASLREPTRRLGAELISYERSLGKQAPRDTICFVYAGHNEGGASCGIWPKAIEEGGATQSSTTAFSGVVPDRVATVTLILPAARGQTPQSVTAPVKSNVYAIPVQNPSGSDLSQTVTVIWRSARGRVLKRISNPAAKALAAMCKQNPIPCLLAEGISSSNSGASSSATSTSTAAAAPPVSRPAAVKSATASGKP